MKDHSSATRESSQQLWDLIARRERGAKDFPVEQAFLRQLQACRKPISMIWNGDDADPANRAKATERLAVTIKKMAPPFDRSEPSAEACTAVAQEMIEALIRAKRGGEMAKGYFAEYTPSDRARNALPFPFAGAVIAATKQARSPSDTKKFQHDKRPAEDTKSIPCAAAVIPLDHAKKHRFSLIDSCIVAGVVSFVAHGCDYPTKGHEGETKPIPVVQSVSTQGAVALPTVKAGQHVCGPASY